MTNDDASLAVLADEVVLGLVEGARLARAQRLMRESDGFRALVAAARERLAEIATALPPVPPREGLLDAIERRIDAVEATVVVGAEEGAWIAAGEGVSHKYLRGSAGSRPRTLLIRLAPGSTVPDHDHLATEECFVLKGTVECDGRRFPAGTYMRVEADGQHGPLTAPDGAVLYVHIG